MDSNPKKSGFCYKSPGFAYPWFTGIIDSVFPHGEASAVGFSFFRAYIAYKAPVCDIVVAVMGNVSFVDESDGVSALDASPNPLGKATKFIGRGLGPNFSVSWVPEVSGS